MDIRHLFERHYPGLVRFLYHRVGDMDLAEDLAQVAFVRLAERKPDSPDGWLYVVAANLARDAARGDRRRSRGLALLERERGEVATPSAEPTLLALEEAERVRAALGRLSERDRTLLGLWAEGVSYRDLAAVIGVAATSIAPLLARAQRRLCRAMARNDDRDSGQRHARASD